MHVSNCLPAPFYLVALGTGYLSGSIPFSWLVVRVVRGIDMRGYGSRTVSGTMVGVLVSRPMAVLVGILDILKALVPVWVGYLVSGDAVLAMVVGLGAFLGHCWPVWLGFQGGRGVSVILGSLAVIFPPGAIGLLVALGMGRIFSAGAVAVFIFLAILPVLAIVFPPGWRLAAATTSTKALTGFCLVLFLLTAVKRLEANREPLPDHGKGRVLLRRLFLDRDIADCYRWLHRQPDNGPKKQRL